MIHENLFVLFRRHLNIFDVFRLLKQHDLKGLGGVLLEDVQESLPHSDKALKHLANEVLYIIRPTDKKKILFYNDQTANLIVRMNYLFQYDISKHIV